jgi:hypothetical protein
MRLVRLNLKWTPVCRAYLDLASLHFCDLLIHHTHFSTVAMARQKRVAVERTPSDLFVQSNGKTHVDNTAENGSAVAENKANTVAHTISKAVETQPGITSLIFCVGGIYASL